jgi:hypothetical protein
VGVIGNVLASSFYPEYILYTYYISGIMVSVFETSMEDRSFEPRSGNRLIK